MLPVDLPRVTRAASDSLRCGSVECRHVTAAMRVTQPRANDDHQRRRLTDKVLSDPTKARGAFRTFYFSEIL